MIKPKSNKLSPIQERFCQEFVVDLNGAAAAARAGYSKTRSHITAHELMKQPKIKNKIKELQAKTAARLEVTVEGIAREYKKIIEANIVDFLDEDGGMVNLKKLPREITAAIESVKTSSYYDRKAKRVVNVIQFKMHSKPQALDALGRHVGLFEKDNQQKTVNISVTVD